jgi:hypothetical protein
MDDIIVACSDTKAIDQLFYKLSMIFPVKGLRSFFLGVETLRDGHDLFLTQREYIADLLRKADLDKVKPCPTSVIFLNSKVLISVTLNSIEALLKLRIILDLLV